MDYSLFTPQFKDEVLSKLCSSCQPYRVVSFAPSEVCDNIDLLSTCLQQFREKGFIDNLNLRSASNVCFLSLTADAIDFLNAGGFTFQSEVLVQELTKAQLELTKLQSETHSKDVTKRLADITSIISSVVATAATFVK